MSVRAKLLSAIGVLVILALIAFFWNEARKEVVFLCGNFKPGVSEESVRTQLETGNLLRYRTEEAAEGSRIIVDSAFDFGMHTCLIDVDATGRVTFARSE